MTPARPSLRRALGRRRRGALSLEAMLALPALLVIFSAVAQSMLIAQNRVYLEQAAYAAARSALVHKCPPFDYTALLRSPVAALGALTGSCTDAPRKWEDAARWSLIGAAPSSAFSRGRGACPDLPAARAVVAHSALSDGLAEPFLNRVCYAYEPGNVTVDVAWKTSPMDAVMGAARPPIEATVTYRYPLTTPFRRFLDDGRRADGSYWREGSATVVLR
jgi:hypothetical protein